MAMEFHNKYTRLGKELPNDRQTLWEMLDGINDSIDRLEIVFADDPVLACKTLTGLLQDAFGIRNEDFAVTNLTVKPGFRVASVFIDQESGREHLSALQEALKTYDRTIVAVEDNARLDYQAMNGMIRRAPIFLDEDTEKSYWQEKARDESDPLFHAMKTAFSHLLEILKAIRTLISNRLAGTQTEPPTNDPCNQEAFDVDPPEGSGFKYGPHEGTLSKLAESLGMDSRTLKDQHRSWLWLRRIHRSRWSVYFKCEDRLRVVERCSEQIA